MDSYKVKADIEPNDNYQKALKDFIQANNSFQKLTPQQKEKLIKDLLGYEGFVKFCTFINRGR